MRHRFTKVLLGLVLALVGLALIVASLYAPMTKIDADIDRGHLEIDGSVMNWIGRLPLQLLGVASLVGMAAIIKGMENGMREAMIAMGGADKVLLEQEDVPAEQEHLADQAPGRTMTDVQALQDEDEHIARQFDMRKKEIERVIARAQAVAAE